jgi:HD superfamily phosphodiesterase
MLHDMGGFAPYQQEGVDHALRSTQVVESVLKNTGFPMQKLEAVKAAILTHSYYDPTPPTTPEAILLHDADVLDFSGAIGIARLIALADGHDGFRDTKAVLKLLKNFRTTLPLALHGGAYTKSVGQQRTQELSEFLSALDRESFGFALP